MQALVKTPHTEIILKGEIPKNVLKILKKEFGESFQIEDEDPCVNIRETKLWEKMEADAKPWDAIKVYRNNRSMTQAQLAPELGVLPTHISEMERGKRGISKEMAKKLSKVLKAPVERFL